MLVIEIALGIVVGLIMFNWIGYWARSTSKPVTPEMRQAISDLAAVSPRRGPDGRWIWPDNSRSN